MVRGAGQVELAPLVVAFEAFAQVGLVHLDGASRVGVESGQVAADGFDGPHAHQP